MTVISYWWHNPLFKHVFESKPYSSHPHRYSMSLFSFPVASTCYGVMPYNNRMQESKSVGDLTGPIAMLPLQEQEAHSYNTTYEIPDVSGGRADAKNTKPHLLQYSTQFQARPLLDDMKICAIQVKKKEP
jgi:hypothetical protein